MAKPGWRWGVVGPLAFGLLLSGVGLALVQTATGPSTGDQGRFVLALLLWVLAGLCGVVAVAIGVAAVVLRLVRRVRAWTQALRRYRR